MKGKVPSIRMEIFKIIQDCGMNCKVPKFCEIEIEQKQRSCAEKTIFRAPSVWLFVKVIEQSVKTMAVVLRKIMDFSWTERRDSVNLVGVKPGLIMAIGWLVVVEADYFGVENQSQAKANKKG